MSLTLVDTCLSTKAEGFDSEAISQVNKGIAEWKLMNGDKSDTRIEQTVYVSSSLNGIVERDGYGGIRGVKGLTAFGDDYGTHPPLEERIKRAREKIAEMLGDKK